ncbi:MAG: FlgD immunoglobulin-like domain containing protein [Bacteroidota bacterium]|nr:FlgD immunoglobulin-like domain containing protein [Bacteroidota bacterium]
MQIYLRWIERATSAMLVVLLLSSGSQLCAQPQPLVAHLLSPPRNFEIRLGDSLQAIVRITNTDNVAHSAIRVEYRIRNVVTLIPVYDDTVSMPSLAAGGSIDLKFPPYPTNPNILSELGTFDGCAIIAGDTTCARLFGVRRTAQPFRDPSGNYSHTSNGDIPDQTLWVSVGATVVDGEDSTWDPPPPRDLNGGGYGPDKMHSPVIRLDRKDLAGNSYAGANVGDTLTSFPINLYGQTRLNLSFDYARGSRTHFPFNWDRNVLQGPESTMLDQSGRVIRAGDSLVLEFKKPTEPATNPSPNGWDRIAAIDGGHDFEFKPFIARGTSNQWIVTLNGITDTISNTSNYLDTNFRFRLRLKAKNDGSISPPPADDADPWYIDNPTVIVPRMPEVEVLWVRVVNSYSKVPSSQAMFPVYMNVLSYGASYDVPYRVSILDPLGDTVYSQRVILAGLEGGVDTVLRFPDWDATEMQGNKIYTVSAAIDEVGYDDYSQDNQTSSKFFLNVDTGSQAIQEFAFDDAGITPARGAGNDIPILMGWTNGGIGFKNISGSLAMKFQLTREDMLYGVRLYFSDWSNDAIGIRISVLTDDPNASMPGGTVVLPGIRSTFTDVIKGGYFDEFWPYYFPKPMVLPPGTYWLSVSQLGATNMNLGGDFSRGGGEFVSTSNVLPRIRSMYAASSQDSQSYGTQWGSGPSDNNGDVSRSFAIETPAGSGLWMPLMPDTGAWPAMTSSSALQPELTLNLGSAPLISVGTYLPMIRPMFGNYVPPPRGVASGTSPSSTFGLTANYPNPFDPSASPMTIEFMVPLHAPTFLIIRNLMGQTIRTLLSSSVSPGVHSLLWDGRDEHGTRVPAGTYFISLASSGEHSISKVIVTE